MTLWSWIRFHLLIFDAGKIYDHLKQSIYNRSTTLIVPHTNCLFSKSVKWGLEKCGSSGRAPPGKC